MKFEFPICCGNDTSAELAEFCQVQKFNRFMLVADQNTYAALGRRVEVGLTERGWDVRTMILNGEDVIADERRIFDVLFSASGEERCYLAVGSGTITDITRYASFCSRNPFISLPTAPSVDAYASGGAALVMGGFKLTVPSQAPSAIFADLATLCKAPRDMIAAGFGDVLGKYTSLADWRLGALLLDEPFRPEIAERSKRALSDCVTHVDEIGCASTIGIRTLIGGLFESGKCMMDYGSSRPASGSEHLLSHFWEIKLMQQSRPAILHGAKVGVGTVLVAGRYEALQGLARQQAVQRLANAALPSRSDEIDRMRRVFGSLAHRIISNYLPFLDLLEARSEALRHRIANRWDEIQDIAASVPSAQETETLLQRAAGKSHPRAVGLGKEDVQQALEHARYLRARFTVFTLDQLLGLS